MPLQVLALPSKAEVIQSFPRASTSLPSSEGADCHPTQGIVAGALYFTGKKVLKSLPHQ